MTRTVSERHQSRFSQRLVARLHTLARDHREGRLSLEAYRKLRAPLLDCLDSHHAADFQSATLPNQEMRLREAGAMAVASTLEASATPTGRPRRRFVRALTLVAVGGLLIALGIAAAWWTHERAAVRRPVSLPCNSCLAR